MVNLGRTLSFCVKTTNHRTYLKAGGSGDDSVLVSSVITPTLRSKNEGRRSVITNVTTECVLWRYDNAFLFTNQSEVDFGIAHVKAFCCNFST